MKIWIRSGLDTKYHQGSNAHKCYVSFIYLFIFFLMRKLQEPIDKLEMDIISQIFSKYISQVLHIHTNLWVKHIRNLMSASALLYADMRRLHLHNYDSFEKNMER